MRVIIILLSNMCMQISAEEKADELVERPIASGPFVGKFFASDPLISSPVVGRPVVKSAFAGEFFASDPLVGSSVADSSLTATPLIGSPLVERSLASTPPMRGPLSESSVDRSRDESSVDRSRVDSPSVDSPIMISVADFLGGMAEALINSKCLTRFVPTPLQTTSSINRGDLVTVHMQSPDPTELIRTVVVHDPEGVLRVGGEFSLERWFETIHTTTVKMTKASGCTRNVAMCELLSGKYKGLMVCLKQWPEAPGIDILQHIMACSSLYPDQSPFPASGIILIEGEVFLVSEFIHGIRFDVLLKEINADPSRASRYKFNRDRLQRAILHCLITSPEDCRPQNLIVRQIPGTEEVEFVFIDFDRSLGKPFTALHHHPTRGEVSTRVHCALFCFHEVLAESIHDQAYYDYLIHLKFVEPTLRCISMAANSDRFQMALHRHVLCDTPRMKTLLGVPRSNHEVVTGMSRRIGRMVEALRSNRNITIAALITQVEPAIAHTYKLNEPDPAEFCTMPELLRVSRRIIAIDGNRFSTGPTPCSADVPLEVYLGIPATGCGSRLSESELRMWLGSLSRTGASVNSCGSRLPSVERGLALQWLGSLDIPLPLTFDAEQSSDCQKCSGDGTGEVACA